MYKEGISFPSIIESYAGTLHEAKDEIQFTKNIQILKAKKENIIPAFIPKESLEFRPKLAHVPFENLEIIPGSQKFAIVMLDPTLKAVLCSRFSMLFSSSS